MEIIKEKYSLRPWQTSDLSSLAKSINNLNIWNNVRDGLPYPYTEKHAEEFISQALSHPTPLDFAIVIDQKAVGGIGFVPQTDVERLNAEIGYWLGQPYWSMGIMTEVVKEITRYVFDNTEIIRLFAGVYEYNVGSMRVLEKAGFDKLCVMRNAAIKNGKLWDMHYFELLKENLTHYLPSSK